MIIKYSSNSRNVILIIIYNTHMLSFIDINIYKSNIYQSQLLHRNNCLVFSDINHLFKIDILIIFLLIMTI